MPSTASPRLRTEQQALGENLSSWGYPKLNDALLRLEEAIAGVATITLTGATYSLNVQNFVPDEARMAVLVFSGTITTPCTVTTPAVQKEYLVINKTAQNVVLTTGSGSTAVCRPGIPTAFYCDATNWVAQDPTLDQIKTATGTVNLGGQRLSNVGATAADTDAISRGEVNTLTAANVQLASDWAQKTSGSVDGANGYSARLWATSTTALAGGFKGAYGYAQDAAGSATAAGTQAGNAASSATSASGSAGLAQQWATTTGAQVAATDYSAKEYAIGTTVPAGSAKAWATSTAVVAGGLKGAQGYAQDASGSATAAANSATAAQNAVGSVKVSGTDTTPGNLLAKLAAGTGLTFTKQNPGANETLRLDVASGSAAKQPVVTKSAAYSFALADLGSIFIFTGGPYTIGSAAPSTLTAGWWAKIRNGGTAILTFTPGSGVTVNGRSSILIYPGEAFEITTDGANFVTDGRNRVVTISQLTVASSVSTVDFVSMLADAELNDYDITINNVANPSSANLQMTMGYGGSFASPPNFTYTRLRYSIAVGSVQGDSLSSQPIILSGANGGTPIQANIRISGARGATVGQPTVAASVGGGGDIAQIVANSSVANANFDSVRFALSSGTIAAGASFVLRGIR